MPILKSLSPDQVEALAHALFNGKGVDLRGLSNVDAGRILSAWVRLTVAAWEAQQLAEADDEGRTFNRPVREPLIFGPGQPSEIVADILSSPECVALLGILAAAVSAASIVAAGLMHKRVSSPWAEQEGISHKSLIQALRSFLRKKFEGTAVYAGTEHLPLLSLEVRAWANSIPRAEALYWSAYRRLGLWNVREGRPAQLHYHAACRAGARLRETWGTALAAIGVQLEALESEPMDLPAFDPFEWSPPEDAPSPSSRRPSPIEHLKT